MPMLPNGRTAVARSGDINGVQVAIVGRHVGNQATAAAQTAYSTGNDVLSVVEGFTRENVWGSLLIAAAVGYGLACVVKNARS